MGNTLSITRTFFLTLEEEDLDSVSLTFIAAADIASTLHSFSTSYLGRFILTAVVFLLFLSMIPGASAMIAQTNSRNDRGISDLGNADSTTVGRDTAMAIFAKFCTAEEHPQFNDMSEDYFCDSKLTFAFANYCVYTYVKVNEAPLMMQTVTQYVGRVMSVAKAHFGNDNKFFDGLESNAPLSHWYKEMLKNVERNICRRCIEAGDPVTTQPPPTGRSIMSSACLVYFLAADGDQEGLFRRFVLATLFAVAGRGGEVAANTWNLCQWDYTLNALYFAWQQPKNLKQKGAFTIVV
jgi:hypothetical protein